MGLVKFFHHLFNPHCSDCKLERAEAKEELKLLRAENREIEERDQVCPSCETYMRQLEIVNHNNERLLDRILEKPAPEPTRELPDKYIPPRQIPWALRRQALEAEDRRRAQLMRNAPKPDSATPVVRADVNELEKELEVNDGAQDKETENKDTPSESKAV